MAHASKRARDLYQATPGPSLGSSDDVVAAFVDLAGFTAISEQLSREGTAGTEALTHLINTFFDPVIDDAERNGGDVVGFGGDAITVVFDCHPNIGVALAWAARVQERTRALDTTTKGGTEIRLRAKIGIGAGAVRTAIIGAGGILREVTGGPAIDAAASSEASLGPGEVGIHESAAVYVDHMDLALRENTYIVQGVAASAKPAGHPVTAIAQETRIDLSPFVDSEVDKRVSDLGIEMLNEHRPVTVMFVGLDSAGLTATSFRELNETISLILRFGGTILTIGCGDKGTTILVAFGAPQAKPQQRLGAVRAGLELSDHVNCRVGITTGTCFAGQVGAVSRWNYNLMGDPPNAAARLMTNSISGQVRVDTATKAGLERHIAFGAVEQLALKGKSGKHPTFVAESIVDDTAPVTTELPFVGRQDELQTLSTALVDPDQRVRGVYEVVGEPGLGKSRLIRELVDSATAANTVWMASAGIADNAWDPWIRVIRQAINVSGDSGPAEAAVTIAGRLRTLSDSRRRLLGDVLLGTLDVSWIGATTTTEQAADLIRDLLVDAVLALGSLPTTIVVDDRQLLSTECLDILGRVSRRLAESDLTIISTSTEESSNAGLARSLKISLHPLNRLDSANLVKRHLAHRSTDVDSTRIDEIVNRGGGNPQLLRLLADHAAEAGYMSDSDLTTILMSRVDNLQPAGRQALTLAAAIGTRFSLGDLVGSLGDKQTRSTIDLLLRSRLLERAAADEVVFVSPMLRRVVYDAASHRGRAQLHHRIGDYLEVQPNSDKLRATELAHHFSFTDDLERKRRYFPAAARHCQRVFDNADAIGWFERALQVATTAERPTVLLDLGTVLEHTGDWNEAVRRLDEAANMNTAVGVRSLASLGRIQHGLGDPAEGSRQLERALIAAEELADDSALEWVLECSALVASLSGDDETALRLGMEQFEVASRLNDRRRTAAALSNVGAARSFLGDDQGALRDSLAALEMLDHEPSPLLASVQTEIAMTYFEIGDRDAATGFLESAVKTAIEVGDRRGEAAAVGNLALVELDSNPNACKTDAVRSAELGIALGDVVMVSSPFGLLGMLHLSIHDATHALPWLTRCVRISRLTAVDLYRDRAYGLLADAYDALDDHERAEACRDQAERTEEEVSDEEFEFVAARTDPAESGLDDELVELLRQADELIDNIPAN